MKCDECRHASAWLVNKQKKHGALLCKHPSILDRQRREHRCTDPTGLHVLVAQMTDCVKGKLFQRK